MKKIFWISTIVILLLIVSLTLFLNDKKYIKEPGIKERKITHINSLKNAKIINIAEFGGYPNDSKDDTDAFNKALAESFKEPIKLVLEKGIYETSENVEVFHSKGIYIVGNGAVIKPKNPMKNPPEFYGMKIFGDKDQLMDVEIENLTIDGSRNPQDLFFTMKTAEDFYKTPMTKGIYVENTKNVSIHNNHFKHMYGGYCVHLVNYENVEINNIEIIDVGGDDITDSFGNAIYLGGHEGKSVVNIDKVIAQGKTSSRSKEYMGWIGVVYENGTIQHEDTSKWLKDMDTEINITNSKFIDYETTFHIESAYGNVYWNVDNLYTKAKDYLIAAGVNGEFKELSNRVTFDMLPYGRNGQVSGVYYTDKMKDYQLDMYNSTINHIDNKNKKALVSLAYGNDTNANFHNIIVNDLPNLIAMNATANIYDSYINIENGVVKDKLGSFNKDTQKINLYKTEISEEKMKHKQRRYIETPPFYKNTGKTPPKMDKPLHQVELKDE